MEYSKRLLDSIGYGQTLWSFLVPASINALLVAGIGYLADYGPFALALAFINAFAISLLIVRISEGKKRLIALTIFFIVIFAFAIWAATIRSKEEGAYALTTPGGVKILRDGKTLPNGENRVTSINTRVDVQNLNSFPIYYRVLRRYGSVEGRGSSIFSPEDENAPPAILEPGIGLYCDSDPIEGELDNGEYHDGEVDCQVRYGRTPEVLDKFFVYQTKFKFFLCPGSALICGPVLLYGNPATAETSN